MVVNPIWPLLAIALSGAVPGLLWLAYNAYAMNSATRSREFIVAASGIVGAALIAGLLFGLRASIPPQVFPYLLLLLIAWKMMAGYFVYLDQDRNLDLFQYYGGAVRRGLLPMIGIAFLGRVVGVNLAQVSPLLGMLFYDRVFLG